MITGRNQTFCIFARHQCANRGARCQDLANRKQDIFGMKTTFKFKLVEKAVPHILQSSAKTLKVQNVELFKITILEKSSFNQ